MGWKTKEEKVRVQNTRYARPWSTGWKIDLTAPYPNCRYLRSQVVDGLHAPFLREFSLHDCVQWVGTHDTQLFFTQACIQLPHR